MQEAAGLHHTGRLVHSLCDGAAWPVDKSSTLGRIPRTRACLVGFRVSVGVCQVLSAAAVPTAREHMGQEAARVDELQHLVKCRCACWRAAVPVQEH